MSDIMDLWRQANKEQQEKGEDDVWRRERYRDLLLEAGLLKPGPMQRLKCGWPRRNRGN